MTAITTPIYALPGPPTPFGQFSEYANLINFFRDPISTMRAHYRTYGHISGAISNQIKDQNIIFAFGPDTNRQVLSNPDIFHTSSMLDIKNPAVNRLSTGLTFMNGETHKTKRRLIMPAFHRQYIEEYRHDMVAVTQRLLDTWHAGQTLDIMHHMHQLTASIAIKTLFGLDTTKEGGPMGKLITQWMGLAVSPLLRIIPFNLPGTPYRKMLAVSKELDKRYRQLIEQKQQLSNPESDVLAILIQAEDETGNRLSVDELIGQMNVLFLAGHETSGNALAWTLFLLSQHPNIMHGVLDELDSVLGGDAPSIEQLSQLPLLEWVIKESMRLLPPVAWIQRIVSEPAELGNYEITPGSTVILSHFMTHHMPEVYENPESFNPTRWERINPTPYEYIAFSAGSRMCIGSSFAMMEMKIALAMILQRYRLSTAPNATINRQVTVTLTAKNGIAMSVHKQDRQFRVQPVRGDIHELVQLPR